MKKFHDVLPTSTTLKSLLEDKDKKIKTLDEYKMIINILSQRLERAMEHLEQISFRFYSYRNIYNAKAPIQYYQALSTFRTKINAINNKLEKQKANNPKEEYSSKLH